MERLFWSTVWPQQKCIKCVCVNLNLDLHHIHTQKPVWKCQRCWRTGFITPEHQTPGRGCPPAAAAPVRGLQVKGGGEGLEFTGNMRKPGRWASAKAFPVLSNFMESGKSPCLRYNALWFIEDGLTRQKRTIKENFLWACSSNYSSRHVRVFFHFSWIQSMRCFLSFSCFIKWKVSLFIHSCILKWFLHKWFL